MNSKLQFVTKIRLPVNECESSFIEDKSNYPSDKTNF